MARKKRKLTVRLSKSADIMMGRIWLWNEQQHGRAHAESFVEFLYNELQKLASHPLKGSILYDFPSLRRLVMSKKSRRQGYVAVYRVLDDIVEVLFIYHTAQDWRSRLLEEDI